MSSGRAIAIDNLLLNCAKLRPGSAVLFVNENDSESTSRETVEAIEARAREIGADVRSMWIDHVPGPEDMPAATLDAVVASDVAVFTTTWASAPLAAGARERPGRAQLCRHR